MQKLKDDYQSALSALAIKVVQELTEDEVDNVTLDFNDLNCYKIRVWNTEVLENLCLSTLFC